MYTCRINNKQKAMVGLFCRQGNSLRRCDHEHKNVYHKTMIIKEGLLRIINNDIVDILLSFYDVMAINLVPRVLAPFCSN